MEVPHSMIDSMYKLPPSAWIVHHAVHWTTQHDNRIFKYVNENTQALKVGQVVESGCRSFKVKEVK